jgi:hypothetical protein
MNKILYNPYWVFQPYKQGKTVAYEGFTWKPTENEERIALEIEKDFTEQKYNENIVELELALLEEPWKNTEEMEEEIRKEYQTEKIDRKYCLYFGRAVEFYIELLTFLKGKKMEELKLEPISFKYQYTLYLYKVLERLVEKSWFKSNPIPPTVKFSSYWSEDRLLVYENALVVECGNFSFIQSVKYKQALLKEGKGKMIGLEVWNYGNNYGYPLESNIGCSVEQLVSKLCQNKDIYPKVDMWLKTANKLIATNEQVKKVYEYINKEISTGKYESIRDTLVRYLTETNPSEDFGITPAELIKDLPRTVFSANPYVLKRLQDSRCLYILYYIFMEESGDKLFKYIQGDYSALHPLLLFVEKDDDILKLALAMKYYTPRTNEVPNLPDDIQVFYTKTIPYTYTFSSITSIGISSYIKRINQCLNGSSRNKVETNAIKELTKFAQQAYTEVGTDFENIYPYICKNLI